MHRSEHDLKNQLLLAMGEIRRLQGQLREMRQQDPLTGLPNRHRLMDRMGQAIMLALRQGHLAAFLFIEIDRFKFINQTLGFEEADDLWKQFARRLAVPLRMGDTLARVSNDQFAMLLPELGDPLEPCRVAQCLLESIRSPFRISGNRELSLSASIGISIHPQDGEDAFALLKQAETATLQAKREGGNCYLCSTPTLNESLLERRELETYLGEAIAMDELELVYQPQCTSDGAIIGMEALLRWQHPVLGAVPPSKFIPLAEGNQLIHPIGEWVLRNACRQMSAWRSQSLWPFRLSVNVSPLQITQPRWVESVAAILQEFSIPPGCLEIEITEGTLLRSAKAVHSALHEIKSMGIRIGIDDFGTGYSSLSYLQRLPIDTLKIDQSFVNDLHPDHPDVSSLPIVQTILDLGHNLGLDVIAEGVETLAQQETLSRMGCHFFQGYLLGRPMKAEDIASRFGAPGCASPIENPEKSQGVIQRVPFFR